MAVEQLLDEPVPDARAVPAGDPLRAEPDPLASRLARHVGARPRRDLDLLVLLPRARQGARPVRVLLRAADAHALLPGRRRVRGHPRRLGPQDARVRRRHGAARRAVRGAARPQRDLPPAHQGHRHRRRRAAARAGRHRTAAARRRQPVGPAQGRRPTARTTTSTSRSRSAPSATATTATACGSPRSRSRARSSGRRSRACPRARTSPTTARWRCRRGTSWRPRWRR